MNNPASDLRKGQLYELFPTIAERYELHGTKAIGAASGFGAVWRANDNWLNRNVALKFSNSDLSDELCLCRDIEGQTVRIFDYFRSEDGWNAYAMELLEEPWISLSQFIEKRSYKPHDLQHCFDCFEIARSILNGLAQIHGRPYSRTGCFVHADIKPDNMFLMLRPKRQAYSVFRMPAEDVLVKIIDMGISTARGDPLPGCTPAYSRKPIPCEARPGVDLYALAVTFLEMLTRVRPSKHTMGHKTRIRSFVAGHSSGSCFIDNLVVNFSNHCAKAWTQPAFSARKLLVSLEENLFAIDALRLLILRRLNKGMTAGLTKAALADFLFDTFAAYYGWRKKTELRIKYIKDVITEMYCSGMLLRSGHCYSLR
jgi:eukaryotic-like serine/threonine-protein kinase